MNSNPLWRRLTLAVIFIVTLVAQRIYIEVPNGQSQPATLQLLPFALALLAAAVTIRDRGRNLVPLLQPRFLVLWGPYLVLALIFPVLGVVITHLPVRTLAATQVPVFAICAIVLGAELAQDPHGLGVWRWALFAAVTVQAIYAVLQQLVVGSILPPGPWDWILTWDITTQHAYSTSVVIGRSSGFYTNPNILGAAGGIALLLGIFAARPRLSYVIVGATFAAMLLSQSRGAAVALVAALGYLLFLAWRRGQLPHLKELGRYGGVIGVVAAGWLLLVVTGSPASTLLGRLGQGITLQDPNVTGRIEFWEAGLHLMASHPFGTFGPPEQLLGTAVDSDWVRALLEGGPIFALTLALALGGGALIRGRDTDERRLLRGLSVFVAVAAITQLPLAYPSAFLYWAVVGTAMTAQRTNRIRTQAGERTRPTAPLFSQRPPETSDQSGSRAAAVAERVS